MKRFFHTILMHVVILGALLLGAVAAHGASDIRFRSMQTQKDLSNDDVNCIFKGSHGFMWSGTGS